MILDIFAFIVMPLLLIAIGHFAVVWHGREMQRFPPKQDQ